MHWLFIRIFDITFSIIGLVIFFPIFVIIFLLGYFDNGSPLFFQERIGLNKKIFVLIKFRTMHLGTGSFSSHLIDSSSITPLGRILRRTKFDELPQLWNVVKGDMSLVGPRPGLLNQIELIDFRQARGVFDVRPGITGLSQINGVDMSTPDLLAETDAKMIKKMSIALYFKIIFLTLIGRGRGDAAVR